MTVTRSHQPRRPSIKDTVAWRPRIAAAPHFLVMVQDNIQRDLAYHMRLDEKLVAKPGVKLHQFPLLLRQTSGAFDDARRDAVLANIVE